MTFDQILQLAKEVSPWLVALGTVVWFGNRFLVYLTKRREPIALEQVRDELKDINDEVREMSRVDAETQATWRNIEAQLVIMNAREGGGGEAPAKMSFHNQKRMIEYQVAWCRESSFSAMKNSILKNNIKDREDIVIQKMYRAFKSCANEAIESLKRLEGWTYDYEALFRDAIPKLWPRMLAAAIPLYHRDLTPGDTLDLALVDLAERIEIWFDEALSHAFNSAEDPETGAIYCDSVDVRTSAETDEWIGIAHKLRDYSKSDPSE